MEYIPSQQCEPVQHNRQGLYTLSGLFLCLRGSMCLVIDVSKLKTMECKVLAFIIDSAYPFVSDEFGEVTNDWLDRMLKECETAKNAEGKEKCNIRCAVINERVKILYAYHNWIYAACRKEYDCCEEERYLAKAENRAFRLELFPMEAERLAAEAKKAAAKQAETPQEKPNTTFGYDKKTGKFYAKPLSTESLKEPGTLPPSPAAVLPAGVPWMSPVASTPLVRTFHRY